MTTDTLTDLMLRADKLTLDEQLRLIAYLVERARTVRQASIVRRRWRELRGLARYPLTGEDAQAWVSRERREADEIRGQHRVSQS